MTPNVFPRLMGEDLADQGLDLHDLAALFAFAALLSKFSERYSGLGLDQLAEQSYKAADAFLDARRDPRPRPTTRDAEEGGAA